MAKDKSVKSGAENKKKSAEQKEKSGTVPKVPLAVVVKPKSKSKTIFQEPIAKLETPMAHMVREAFGSMHDRKGCTLVSIRNYIAKKHDVEMTKRRQNIIKKFIDEEFRNGRIKMANDDGNTINYTKRFKLIVAASSK